MSTVSLPEEAEEELADAWLIYRLPKPQRDGRTALSLTPLEFIDHLAALIPPPSLHHHQVAASSSIPQPTAVSHKPTDLNCLGTNVPVPMHTMFCGALTGSTTPKLTM